VFQVVTAPDDFTTVKEALEAEGVTFAEASISMIPKNITEVNDEKTAKQILKLLENLEENEDVQNVHANFDIPDEIMETIS